MDEPNNDWQASPAPPEKIRTEDEEPQMTEAATLGNVFIEPGRTFEDLRRKPRFLLAGLIIILAVSAFNVLFIQKIGFERLVRERIESNSRVMELPSEQRENLIEQQSGTIAKTISYIAPPIVLIIFFLAGGLLYWLGANAMGGTARFWQGVSVWVYSSLPPTVIFMLANVLVLLLKSVDDIDINGAQSGLIQANPGILIDGKANPVLAALLSGLDLFAVWGWILAAIGLQKVAKISSGAAWAIVLILGLVGITFKVVAALLFG
jgi:hypothetical protein